MFECIFWKGNPWGLTKNEIAAKHPVSFLEIQDGRHDAADPQVNHNFRTNRARIMCLYSKSRFWRSRNPFKTYTMWFKHHLMRKTRWPPRWRWHPAKTITIELIGQAICAYYTLGVCFKGQWIRKRQLHSDTSYNWWEKQDGRQDGIDTQLKL